MNSTLVVVDTDVASFLLKGDTRAGLYHPHLRGRGVLLSFMSMAEMYRWAEKYRWGHARRQQLEEHMRGFVLHGCNRELCQMWARIMAQAERSGRRLARGDAWIAATAVLHGIPLVTHNRRHYEGVQGLHIICEA